MFEIPTIKEFERYLSFHQDDEWINSKEEFKNFLEEIKAKETFNRLYLLLKEKYFRSESDRRLYDIVDYNLDMKPLQYATEDDKRLLEEFMKILESQEISYVALTRELNQLKDKIDGEDVSTVSDSNV